MVRVWDLPTRLFHWALVACVVCSTVTGYLGGAWIEWHARSGYALLALLLFRLAWGFVGGRWSRFASFVRPPATVLVYLRAPRGTPHGVGHNPLGALAVLAMLAVLLLQAASGLVSDDEIAFTGPLNGFASNAGAQVASWYHTRVGQWLLFGLVALHSGAIAWHCLARRRNLVLPMLTGDCVAAEAVAGSRDDLRARLLALGLLALCAGIVAVMVSAGRQAST
jgi:cytochrome b